MADERSSDRIAFTREVADRFGVLPNFFCSADAAPGSIEDLWTFAKSAYLDSPLPSLFKERLFVHLSRFCRVRYSIVRHAGFLVGHGRPAGDAAARPETVDQVIELLRRPVPDGPSLTAALDRLEHMPAGGPLPAPRSAFEGDLFDALTVMFLWPPAADRARKSVRLAVGDATFEWLVACLAYIRTAHYWTETHPELSYESDVIALLNGHAALADLLLDPSEAELLEGSLTLRDTLRSLERARADLRESEEQFRSFVTAASDILYKMNADWSEMHLLHGKGVLADTASPRLSWLDTYVPDSDKPLVRRTIAAAIRAKTPFELEHRVVLADGGVGWTFSRATPLLNKKGDIVEWLGAASDITERKRTEANLTFLAEVSQHLTVLTSIDDTMTTLGAKIGAHFTAPLVAFAEVDDAQEVLTVTHQWHRPDGPSVRGVYRISDFHTEDFRRASRAGDTYVVRDAATDKRSNAEKLASLNIASFVSVPLIRDAQWRFQLTLSDEVPRDWRDDEIELMRELTTRIWARLERARADEILRESEARHRTLFDAVDEAACLIERLPLRADGRRDYRYLAMNPAMQAMFQIPDLSGQSIRDNFPDEVEDWYDDYDRVLATGQPIRFERESVPQGMVLEMFVTRVEDGSARRLLAVMQDVTARRRAEAALQESEARQAFLLKLSDAVRSLATSGEIQKVACQLLAERLDVARAYCVEVDEAAGVARVERDVVRDGARSLAGEHRVEDFAGAFAILRRGERYVISDTQSSPLVPPAERGALAALQVIGCIATPLIKRGQLVGALCVTTPHPREWSESEVTILQEVAERIWGAVERTRAEVALRKSEEQLREADRRKDEFLAMLAHELRNPLAPIRTGLELIRVAGNTPAAVERVRSMMDRQVGHMVRLIDDLLDVSRITSGKIQLQREPTPLRSLVNSAIDANRAAMAAKDISLQIELPESLCLLDVDPTRFVQVVSNLLNNATKFTDTHGTIRVSGRISRAAANPSRELTLSVADSGVGISREFLPRVFDLFSQGTGASSQPGLGIGLALARRLVEMQGGTIDARSDGRGRGSEFVIRLPLSSASLPTQADDAIASEGVDCRVVVIDDNRDAAAMMAMLIEEMGGACRTAYDGDNGLREVLSYRPDAVLLDIGMPGLDGYETCRRIRREVGNTVLVIAVTGFGQQQDRDRATRAGFDAHLTKPAEPAALRKLLSQCRSPRTLGRSNAG